MEGNYVYSANNEAGGSGISGGDEKIGQSPAKAGKEQLSEYIDGCGQESGSGGERYQRDGCEACGRQIDNLHTALIQAEQSAAAIEFTTQLTSKAVSAYTQIMGMQI